MEYQIESKILDAVETAQREGFTLDQTIKLVHKAWRVIDSMKIEMEAFRDDLDDFIKTNNFNKEFGVDV